MTDSKLNREQMNVVVVGHVDHGKSTLLGRLFADTNSLPEGKLEQVKEMCKRNSKEFEYAFLLDALKDEQSQGITIDSARAFFKTEKRDYIIIDAPGHIEFLKNMISGAARAEAALLLIDANEGIQENSKRHAYMLSMLGIKQVVVCVNKMDLVNYDKTVFEQIKSDYGAFLNEININPKDFIAISAREGDNIVSPSKKMDWFDGNSILSVFDNFEKEKSLENKPFRMFVQDVYKFTGKGDNRRIISGRIDSGKISIGDKVLFLPSNKLSEIASVDEFNVPESDTAYVGQSIGFTLKEQIYVHRGDLMCKESEVLPNVSSIFKANLFWMGKKSLIQNHVYKLKIGTMSINVKIKEILKVLDASNLKPGTKNQVDRHEVAECLFETLNPIAFDIYSEIKSTGRFVLVDNYEISGGGIITEFIENKKTKLLRNTLIREKKWEHGTITNRQRTLRYSQKAVTLLITGESSVDKKTTAKLVERKLFDYGQMVYFLGIGNILRGLDVDIDKFKEDEHIRRFTEVSHLLLDAGLIVVATASDLTDSEIETMQTIVGSENLIVIEIKSNLLSSKNVDLKLKDDSTIIENTNMIINYISSQNIIFNFK